MSGYIGTTPVPQSTQSRQSFTATASQTTFNTSGYTAGFVDVYLNGVKLVDGTDFTATNGSDVVLTTGASASDVVDIVMFGTFEIANTSLTDATINDTLTLKNATEEDTDGGRESTIIFKGEQSGGEISTLAEIEASHDGTSDDEKGDLIFRTNDGSDGASPTEAMRIESDQQVLITTSADAKGLTIKNSGNNRPYLNMDANRSGAGNNLSQINFKWDGTDVARIIAVAGADTTNKDDAHITFGTASAGSVNERMRIDSDGNVGIGTDSPFGTTGGRTVLSLNNTSDNRIGFGVSGTERQYFYGDATNLSIINTQSGYVRFSTADTERARFLSTGVFLIGQTTDTFPTAGVNIGIDGKIDIGAASNPLDVNRSGTDGSVIRIFGQGTEEGEIKVLGSTVSLVGGHLSRWSQFTDGSKDTSILRGTVMTNLDQMAVWSHDAVAATYYEEGDELPMVTEATYYEEGDTIPEGSEIGDIKTEAIYAEVGDEKTPAVDAYTEDNEQLNCMAVSSVEGDVNVAGVFEQWDEEEDGFNDLVVAMTGDNVIRIAQGVTVARGDLLMSAGDGTAKPQDDDIVRSKTIAKVTSTNVSHTYDDGSYLVPCVLMAC